MKNLFSGKNRNYLLVLVLTLFGVLGMPPISSAKLSFFTTSAMMSGIAFGIAITLLIQLFWNGGKDEHTGE